MTEGDVGDGDGLKAIQVESAALLAKITAAMHVPVAEGSTATTSPFATAMLDYEHEAPLSSRTLRNVGPLPRDAPSPPTPPALSLCWSGGDLFLPVPPPASRAAVDALSTRLASFRAAAVVDFAGRPSISFEFQAAHVQSWRSAIAALAACPPNSIAYLDVQREGTSSLRYASILVCEDADGPISISGIKLLLGAQSQSQQADVANQSYEGERFTCYALASDLFQSATLLTDDTVASVQRRAHDGELHVVLKPSGVCFEGISTSICAICQSAEICVPTSGDGCEHAFCLSCIHECVLARGHHACPTCRAPINAICVIGTDARIPVPAHVHDSGDGDDSGDSESEVESGSASESASEAETEPPPSTRDARAAARVARVDAAVPAAAEAGTSAPAVPAAVEAVAPAAAEVAAAAAAVEAAAAAAAPAAAEAAAAVPAADAAAAAVPAAAEAAAAAELGLERRVLGVDAIDAPAASAAPITATSIRTSRLESLVLLDLVLDAIRSSPLDSPPDALDLTTAAPAFSAALLAKARRALGMESLPPDVVLTAYSTADGGWLDAFEVPANKRGTLARNVVALNKLTAQRVGDDGLGDGGGAICTQIEVSWRECRNRKHVHAWMLNAAGLTLRTQIASELDGADVSSMQTCRGCGRVSITLCGCADGAASTLPLPPLPDGDEM